MERFTKKRDPSGLYITIDDELVYSDYGIPYEKAVDKKVLQACDKLGRLEDLEEKLDMPLDKAVDLLFKAIKDSEFYDCLTCTNVMHNERGCDGNCSHNREFSRKEILELLELEEKFSDK